LDEIKINMLCNCELREQLWDSSARIPGCGQIEDEKD